MSPDRPPAFSRPGSPRGRGPSICSPHSASLHPHFSPSCLVPSGVPSGTHPGRQGANKSTGTPTHPGAEVAPGCPVSVSPSPASVSSAVNQDAPSICLPGSRRWWLGQVLAPGGCRGQGCFWVHTLAPPAHSGLGRGGGAVILRADGKPADACGDGHGAELCPRCCVALGKPHALSGLGKEK